MKLAELARSCTTAINSCTAMGIAMDQARVLVTTPPGWKAPPRFPRSEIVQVKEDGTRVRYMPAARVLAWLVAQGSVKLVEPQCPAVPGGTASGGK